MWTVRQFDEAYTAPHHGFRDAADYYHRASALRVIDHIRVPTLILTAENDPFVPAGRSSAARRCARTRTCSSWSRPTAAIARSSKPAQPDYDGYWAEREIVRFANAHEATDVNVRLYPYIESARVASGCRCQCHACFGKPGLYAEPCHQQPGELGSLSFLFVLEIDEHIAAAGGFLLHDLGPACDVGGV